MRVVTVLDVSCCCSVCSTRKKKKPRKIYPPKPHPLLSQPKITNSSPVFSSYPPQSLALPLPPQISQMHDKVKENCLSSTVVWLVVWNCYPQLLSWKCWNLQQETTEFTPPLYPLLQSYKYYLIHNVFRLSIVFLFLRGQADFFI